MAALNLTLILGEYVLRLPNIEPSGSPEFNSGACTWRLSPLLRNVSAIDNLAHFGIGQNFFNIIASFYFHSIVKARAVVGINNMTEIINPKKMLDLVIAMD